MGRTLPWLVHETSIAVNNRGPGSSAKQNASSKLDGSKRGNAERRKHEDGAPDERSSSPPQSSELLYPSAFQAGLHGDDIYVMVEDEFLATAQIFTRRLHQDAYQRLRQAAKQRGTSTKVTRPTDSVTPIRKQLQCQKRAQAQRMKVKEGISHALHSSHVGSEGDLDADQTDPNEVDDSEEPWKGTQLLAFLKSNSPQNHMRSLTGLHGAKRNTKAAAGFDKTETSSTVRLSKAVKHREAQTLKDSESDTDDLDVTGIQTSNTHSYRPRKPPGRFEQRTNLKNTFSKQSAPHEESFRPGVLNSHDAPRQHKSEMTHPSFADLSSTKEDPHSFDAIRARLVARRQREQKEKVTAAPAKHDEMPLFL